MLKKFITAIAVVTACALFTVGTASAHHVEYNWHNMVVKCEARGVKNPWYANTGNGYYFGPQFAYSTWRDNGGPRLKQVEPLHPRAISMYRVRKFKIILVAERNAHKNGIKGQWPNCWRYLL